MRRTGFFLLAIVTVFAFAFAAPPRRTMRTLRTGRKSVAVDTVVPVVVAPWDTIVPATGSVRIAGFEKTLRARKESFFMTNNTGDTLNKVCLEIRYRDVKGRQLHNRTLWVDAELPPGGTRHYDIPAWDRQQTFYYRIHPRPKRSDAVPFDVDITVTSATIIRKH